MILIFISILVGGCYRTDPKPKYNVILISIDTLRAGHLSCYGYFRETSPAIDELAEESIVFTNAFSQSAFTLSSHMSMFTSTYPIAHGLMNAKDFVPLSGEIETLPEILRERGYKTFGYHAGGNLAPKYGFDRGFDSYERKDEAEVLRRISEVRRDPLFLFVHYFDVHCTNFRDAEYIYDGPPEFRDKFARSPLGLTPRKAYYGQEKLTEEQLEEVIARYDGGILHVDHQLSELFGVLKKKGLFDESLIIITSDHGESLGFKGVMDLHGQLYDAGTHVPLIVKLPKSYASSPTLRGEVDYQVRVIDIMPTVLDVLGIEGPAYLSGESLLRVDEDRVNYSRQRNAISIRTKDSKIIMFTMDGRHPFMKKGNIEVYALSTDPRESENLYGEDDARSERLLELAGRMDEEAMALNRGFYDPDAEVKTLDKESIEDLKALGYLQ